MSTSSSAAINATLQAGALAALSNVIAQCMTAYRESRPLHLDYTALLQFIVFALLSTPPNYLWQVYLEELFPGYRLSSAEQEKKPPREVQATKKLNVKNTAIKFLLDQTVGNIVNTYLFIAAFAYFRGDDVLQACKTQFWPMRMAALKVWPLVSIACFTVVPVQHRILVCNTVGVFWGIFLSLVAAK